MKEVTNGRHKHKGPGEKITAFFFIAPAILLILTVSIVPIFIAINTSLRETNYAVIGAFAGLKNYLKIFGTAEGWMSIFNSITYVALSLLIVIPLGVLSAILLNRKIPLTGFFRTLIVLPWVLSQTVTALLWKWLLNSSFGPISYIWYSITGAKADFFNYPTIARFTVVFVNAWFTFPVVLILVLAALQSIPEEIYQAAKVDGANRRNILTKITLPMIKPTVMTSIVLQSIQYFSMVTLLFVLTAGGPFGATETISLKAFKEGFHFWHLGLGSAYSIVIFALNIVFSLIYVKVLRNKDA